MLHLRHIHQRIVSLRMHFVSNLEREQVISMAICLCLMSGTSWFVSMFIMSDTPNRHLPPNLVSVTVRLLAIILWPKSAIYWQLIYQVRSYVNVPFKRNWPSRKAMSSEVFSPKTNHHKELMHCPFSAHNTKSHIFRLISSIYCSFLRIVCIFL